jgi:hypothetical protein
MLERFGALVASRHGLKAAVAGLLVVLGTTTGLVTRAATDSPDSGSPDNAAVAVNTRDDSSRFKLSFKVTRTNSDTVDSTNAAVAVGSCTNCETTAIAIQAVIAWGDPSIVSPTNLALAVNINCNLCITYADARQIVITTDSVPKFSAEGNQRIAAIRRELQQLRREDFTIEQLHARIDELSAELADVIADEFLAASVAASESPSPSASPTADSTSTPSPEATAPPTSTAQATPGLSR